MQRRLRRFNLQRPGWTKFPVTPSVLEPVGFLIVVAGIGFIHIPSAMIIAGLAILAVSFILAEPPAMEAGE